MHTRIQLDPHAEVSFRRGKDGAVEMVILDPRSENSAVVEMTREHFDAMQLAPVTEY
jgi:hypothetical protein